MKKNVRAFCINRKTIYIAAGIAALIIILLALTPSAVDAWSVNGERPIYSVDTNGEKLVSLTFDAAWGNEDTQELIDILAEYDIKATFFIVGDWVRKYPESVKALSDAGHEIMNHSDTHPYFTSLTAAEIITEVEACNAEIEAITGVIPSLIRVPYGEYDDEVISTLRSIGMEVIQWNVDSHDWMELSAEEITERVLANVEEGSIVLFHNAALNTPEALPDTIEGLQSQGYTFVTVSELIVNGEYTIDNEGKQSSAN